MKLKLQVVYGHWAWVERNLPDGFGVFIEWEEVADIVTNMK